MKLPESRQCFCVLTDGLGAPVLCQCQSLFGFVFIFLQKNNFAEQRHHCHKTKPSEFGTQNRCDHFQLRCIITRAVKIPLKIFTHEVKI